MASFTFTGVTVPKHVVSHSNPQGVPLFKNHVSYRFRYVDVLCVIFFSSTETVVRIFRDVEDRAVAFPFQFKGSFAPQCAFLTKQHCSSGFALSSLSPSDWKFRCQPPSQTARGFVKELKYGWQADTEPCTSA